MACIAFSGCATVKIYSDDGLKNVTGLRFYTLKPYLLVEYLAEKDKTVKHPWFICLTSPIPSSWY